MSDKKSQIFISSSNTDSKTAQDLVRALSLRGVTAWHDSELPVGDRWMDAMEEKLSQASIYVHLVGPDYHSSRWANFESGVAVGRAAHDKNVALIPVVLTGATWADVPSLLRQWNGIDARQSTPDELATQLVKIVERHKQAD